MTMAARLVFLDALRGVALVVMVLNHTSHWWIGRSMGWGRYHLVYITVTVAAPIFLFLVGFVLPLSLHRYAAAPMPARVWLRYVRRGLGIAVLGYALNALVFAREPIWTNEVLHTIGVSVVLAPLALPALRSRAGRITVLLGAALAYTAFARSFAAVAAWSARHPGVSLVLFKDYPWWPWTSIVAVGLVIGWMWREAVARGAEGCFFRRLAAGGAALMLSAVAAEAAWPSAPRVAFTRDLIINHHWVPAPITATWVVGVVLVLTSAFWFLFEVHRLYSGPLVVLGRTALALYVVHQVIALTIIAERFGIGFHAWLPYSLANAALLVLLVALGRLWLATKARAALTWSARPRTQPA